jgi:uncharacterized protein YciI
MPYFVLTEERGAAWDESRPRREQYGWDEHAAFMDALVDDGFVVLGGPVGDGHNVLLIVDAEDERAVEERLAADPWITTPVLHIASIEPWEVLLGDPARR